MCLCREIRRDAQRLQNTLMILYRLESAALFTVGSYLRVRCGAAFLAVGNQERAKRGLDNPQCHDTDMAVRVGVGALRLLIAQDRAKSDCPR